MKLQYQNNWESDEYFYTGGRIKNLWSVEINGIQYPIITKKVSIPYNDMGHQYNATSDHYFIEESLFGIMHKIDLNTLVNKIDIIPIAYEVY